MSNEDYYLYQRPRRLEKLSKSEQEELLLDLIYAFSLVRSPQDSALLIQDLLTEYEVKNLAKRLRVAKLLLQGEKYEGITKKVHVSKATIAKIAVWLENRGEGFKKIIKKIPEPTKIKAWWEKSDWEQFMSSRTSYFWPFLIPEAVKEHQAKKRKAMTKYTFGRLEEKGILRRKIQERADEEYKFNGTYR
jgi:uncharacterized protein YerC